jgi:hypothetical protein
LLPKKYFYYFKKKNNTSKHEKIDKLYTGIISSSSMQGGLYVMSCYCSQIYVLCTAQGMEITDECHDLTLSVDGTFSRRLSDVYSSFQSFKFDLKHNIVIPLVSDDFNYCELIESLYCSENELYFQSEEKNEEIEYFDLVDDSIDAEFINGNGDINLLKLLLKKKKNEFDCIDNEISIASSWYHPYYREDDELASLALKHNCWIYFSLLRQQQLDPLLFKVFSQNASFPLYTLCKNILQLNFEIAVTYELQMIWLKSYAPYYELLPDLLKKEEAVIIEFISNKNSTINFDLIPEEIRNNRELMEKCIIHNSNIIAHCSTQLKDNFDLVYLAISQNGYLIEYASDRLKQDRNLAISAVRQAPLAINFIDSSLREDEEICSLIQKDNFHMDMDIDYDDHDDGL